MIIEAVVALGLVAFVGLLYKSNLDRINNNEKEINKNGDFLHCLDKKLSIISTTLEIKYPNAFEKAKKKNGD